MAIDGKTVIITGASSGIGEATARTLAAQGANVMLAARRQDRLEALSAELGDRARHQVTDVTRHADMLALAEAATGAFGRIDVLVNNAGVMPVSPLAHRRVDEWHQMVDINIKGVLHGIDAVLTPMLAQGSGHIVNVSSVAGHVTSPGSAVYSGTKYAVRAISEGLRKETAGKIRVTIISPGAVTTELGDTVKDPAMREAMAGRFNFEFLAAEDIAASIAFAIASPARMAVNEILVRPVEQEV